MKPHPLSHDGYLSGLGAAFRTGAEERFCAAWISCARAQESVRRIAAALDRLRTCVPPGATADDDVERMCHYEDRLEEIAVALERGARRRDSQARKEKRLPVGAQAPRPELASETSPTAT
jgi:hypothetical protein